ncbi:MAG: winged helix-turn-helix domain-containing protein [Chloroflexi bacterium]|nr:winged helix-turn-helix domain-containing protein [Chloroflexota bacterium]
MTWNEAAAPLLVRQADRLVHAAYGSVLLVERDPSARQALERALLREGLQTLWARSAAEAEAALATRHPCLVILNPRLAPEDGWQVYRQLRRFQVPVMLLAPRSDAALKRLALMLGADDCVAADSGPEEVATRARFVLQRAAREGAPAPTFGAIALDPALGGARVGGQAVRLTRSEYALLAALIEAQGRVIPREQLVVRARAHAGALPLARSVDGHVRALRRKLGDDPCRPRLLLSVRGFGYRLAMPGDQPSPPLAEAAFEALPDPVLVLDEQRCVKLLNRAAAALVGTPAEAVVDHLSCAALLRCQAGAPGPARCPGLAALAGGAPQRTELVVCPAGVPLVVEEAVVRLPGEPARLLLQLRERPGG